MDQLYDLAVKCRNNSIRKEELITELRGGGIEDWVAAFGMIIAIITVINNVEAFQVPPAPGAIVPPHLQWLYRNPKPGHHFGYGKGTGPRSITVTGATQNAGSEKKQPSSGSYNYIDVMRKLYKQRNQKRVKIEVGDRMYMIENADHMGVDLLENKLAEQMYNSIRDNDKDISDIAVQTKIKADNIKKCKDHIFYNEHVLDRYVHLGDDPVVQRFDPDLKQALAWKRFEIGEHTPEDMEWLKHEHAERYIESTYDAGYTESHDRAQSHFDGNPWNDD